MSLLLEALKKAEQAKRETSVAAPPAIPAEQDFPEISLSLPEPAVRPSAPQASIRVAPGKPDAKTEPVLALDLPEPPPAPIPLPPIAGRPARAPDTPSFAEVAKSQEAAKKILAARQEPPKRNLKLLGGMLLASIALGAAAYYYWKALPRPVSSPAPIAARPPVVQPAETLAATPPQPVPEPAAVEAGIDQPPLALKEPIGEPVVAPKPAKALPAKAPNVARMKRSAIREHPDTRKEPPPLTPPPSAQPTRDSGIKIRRDTGVSRLDPLLAGAYQAFMAGDSGRAESDYRKALQQSPNSRDALLGLAAIAATRGQTQEAANHYLRVLQLDPKDAAAQAGLIGLRGNSDPAGSESRLKTLLGQNPNAAGYLYFALGNLHAVQARWPEAQEAYFNALHNDAANADYAFNLAVSLDHLDQRKPALTYYQRALALVKERPAGFDGEQVKKRISELQAPN